VGLGKPTDFWAGLDWAMGYPTYFSSFFLILND